MVFTTLAVYGVHKRLLLPHKMTSDHRIEFAIHCVTLCDIGLDTIVPRWMVTICSVISLPKFDSCIAEDA